MAMILATACLTGCGFWLLEGRDRVTREQVARMIAEQSPYVMDRQLLLDRTGQVADLTRTVDAVARSQAEMKLVLAIMATREGIALPPDWGHRP